MSNTVGDMRQQCALVSASTRIAFTMTDDPVTLLLLEDIELEVVRTYPDTTNERGQWIGTFKIEIRARRRA